MKAKDKPSREGKCKASSESEYGRMKYSGIDMAFIYVRGKRMLTMSEVARKLYPLWSRTTLSGRLNQLNIQKHLCTPREMQTMYSLNAIKKQGINCRLIAKEDVDLFCTVYQVNDSVRGGDATQANTKKRTLKDRVKQGYLPTKRTTSGKLRKSASVSNKQTENKSNTRALTKVPIKAGRVLCSKKHVANGINKAVSKQRHVEKNGPSTAINKRLAKSTLIRKKQKDGINGKETGKINHNATSAKKRRMRDTNSPASDCTSYDSGISSLSLDSAPSKTKTYKSKKLTTAKASNTKSKAKNLKEQALNKLKKKNEKTKNGRKSKNEVGIKKSKITQRSNKTGTITKEFVMKMKNMNDKDLFNSFSQTSNPFSQLEGSHPTGKDQAYHFKLMLVKPVWKVNSSFRFISNFLLPPSLVVKDGELRPACSMVCNPGLKPPVAHPIWKWKVGEPVRGNNTEISYRVKKIKCTDTPTKSK